MWATCGLLHPDGLPDAVLPVVWQSAHPTCMQKQTSSKQRQIHQNSPQKCDLAEAGGQRSKHS